jgi:hypothetical protein
MENGREFSMAVASPLREDYSAEDLWALARGSDDGP